jgi:hypothetical protein
MLIPFSIERKRSSTDGLRMPWILLYITL